MVGKKYWYVMYYITYQYFITLRTQYFSAIWAQKSLDFQGPPLPVPQEMMLHPSKPPSISAIKTTGTLKVKDLTPSWRADD